MSFEIPLLNAARSGVARNEIPCKIWIERTVPGEHAEHQLTLTVPVSQFNFQTDQGKKQYLLHFAVMALVLNEKGEIVTRMSQDYPMSGKLDRVEGLQKGNFDFVRNFNLPSGSYKLQTVVHDFNSGKSSIREKAFRVPEFNPSLGTGSLVVIKRLEPATTGDGKKNVAASRIIPNLDGMINAASEKSVGFALTIFSASKEPPILDLEITRGSDTVSRSTLKLPEPDEKGRIAYLVSFDSAAFESGAYRVKAKVRQGTAQVEEFTNFVIENPGFVRTSPLAVSQIESTRADTAAAGPATEIAPPVISPVGISDTARMMTRPLKTEKSIGAAPMDIPSLLREVEANGVRIQRALLDYTYHLRKVRHFLNLNGEPVKETFQDYEGYPIKGLHVLIKIADMGRKLSESDIERERKRAGEELGKIAPDQNGPSSFLTAAISGQAKTGTVSIQVDPAVFFQSCEFSDSRIETLGGRETITFDFAPRQGARLQADTSYVSKLTGTIWIDAADKVLVRLEARAIEPGIGKDGKPLRMGPDPKLVYQQMLVPGGGWFPSVIRLNAGGDGTLFYGLNWDVVFEFRDFHRFASNGNDYQIKTSEKP